MALAWQAYRKGAESHRVTWGFLTVPHFHAFMATSVFFVAGEGCGDFEECLTLKNRHTLRHHICIHVFIYVYIYIYIYVCMYVYIYTYVYLYIYIYMYTKLFISICIWDRSTETWRQGYELWKLDATQRNMGCHCCHLQKMRIHRYLMILLQRETEMMARFAGVSVASYLFWFNNHFLTPLHFSDGVQGDCFRFSNSKSRYARSEFKLRVLNLRRF